jgi:hypothetical protein
MLLLEYEEKQEKKSNAMINSKQQIIDVGPFSSKPPIYIRYVILFYLYTCIIMMLKIMVQQSGTSNRNSSTSSLVKTLDFFGI